MQVHFKMSPFESRKFWMVSGKLGEGFECDLWALRDSERWGIQRMSAESVIYGPRVAFGESSQILRFEWNLYPFRKFRNCGPTSFPDLVTIYF